MAEQITIRCLDSKTNKFKNVFPSIANNKQLMKNVGYVISDPNYEAKMEAVRNKKPFSENGVAKEPVKESFVAPVETKPEPKIEMPKNEVKVKRTRRTKAQMNALKKQTI